MDELDCQIAGLLQADGRLSGARIAERLGIPVSTANERLRRLNASGAVTAWRAVFEPERMDAALCAFILLDVDYDGEEEAKAAIAARPEVQEIHHVSGARSYMTKVRVKDTKALQRLLQDHIKALKAVTRTETMLVMETVKETTELPLPVLDEEPDR